MSQTVEQYFSQQDKSLLPWLQQMRDIIREAAPDAEEVLSYGVPAFKQRKIIACYAAHKGHMGLYPTPGPIKAFAKELEPYKTSEGTIQFSYDKKLPKALIRKIIKYRLQEIQG